MKGSAFGMHFQGPVSYTHLEDKAETVYEISDLAYHVLVLMVQAGITVEDVTRELEKRHVIDHKVKQERMQ